MINLKKAICRYRSYRKTLNEISRLTNRELDDIGANRAEIPYLARHMADKSCNDE